MAFWIDSATCQFCGEEHTWFVHSMPAASSEDWSRCRNRTMLLRAMVGRFAQLGGAVRRVRVEQEVYGP